MNAAAVRQVHVLPEDLANQIAAGEVVERPASVIKELIENALDAGATRIRVDIEQGGVALLRVADDGSGMSRDDARLSVLRHATSKIAAMDDLMHLTSFGFRGEALPSIASVTRFELRTRRRDEEEGTLVRIEGGAPAEIGPCGCAAGTAIEVRDLFFNVPVRRKFLKATGTESARVTEVAQAAALGEPGATILLSRDGRVVGEWLRASSREERARSIFGGEELAACRGERGPLSVEAYLSRPERARPGAGSLSIFVNGRHVRDRTLARSIALAYGSVLEAGRFPLGVAYLDLPPDLVDVNVHPQKTEVRFADGRAISDALYKIVMGSVVSAFGLPDPGGYRGKKQKLFEEPAGPAASTWTWGGPAEPPRDPAPAAPRFDPASSDAERAMSELGPETSDLDSGTIALVSTAISLERSDPWGLAGAPAEAPLRAPVEYPTAAEIAAKTERQVVFGALRFVAQVRSTFLICEGSDGLYLLDQHAAAERVTFDRLKKGYDARAVAQQALLFPVVVSAGVNEVAIVEEAHDAIAMTGLDVRVAGPTSLAIHAVPTLLGRASPERLLRDLLGEMSLAGERAFSGAVDRAIATMACHGSLRAGDPVAHEEARALLAALDEVDFSGHCPHGRPVVMRIGWSELEHRVGRR
ncbi:MAG: DNA mismatch repair endonuclease MutL [Byssovorax sp.]